MCIASVKSMTYALKVKKTLSEFYIDSNVVKLDASIAKAGCSYGVEFDCVNLYAVESALQKRGIKYNQIINY